MVGGHDAGTYQGIKFMSSLFFWFSWLSAKEMHANKDMRQLTQSLHVYHPSNKRAKERNESK